MNNISDKDNLLMQIDRLKRTNLLWKTIHDVRLLAYQNHDIQTFLDGLCEVLIQRRGYNSAWVFIINEEQQSIHFSRKGITTKFENLKIDLVKGIYPSCANIALASLKPFVENDPITNCQKCPLSQSYTDCGAITIPLVNDGYFHGILSVSIPLIHLNDSDEMDILCELSSEIKLTFKSLSTELRANVYVSNFKTITDALPTPMSLVGRDYRYQMVNKAYANFLGGSVHDFIGQEIRDILGGNAFDYKIKPHFDVCLSGKSIQKDDWYDISNGKRVCLKLIYTPYLDNHGVVQSVILIVADITNEKELLSNIIDTRENFELAVLGGDLGTWSWQVEADIVDCNHILAQMLGFSFDDTPKDVIGWNSKIHPDDLSFAKSMLADVLSGNKTFYEGEYRLKHKSGKWIWMLCRGRITKKSSDGKPLMISGTNIDITRRKEAELALKQREQYLSTILQTTVDGFCVVDNDGNIVEANDSYCKMIGFSKEEAVGLNVINLNAGESPKQTLKRLERIKKTGYDLFETIHRRRNGSYFNAEISTTYSDINGGQYICFCRDQTDKRSNEYKLSIQEIMLDNAPGSITIHDMEGNFIYANKKSLDLHGYSNLKEFLSINLYDLDVPESSALLESRFKLIAEKGEAVFHSAHYRKDGSILPLEVMTRLIEWNGIPAIMSIAADMTERIKSEDLLRARERNTRAKLDAVLLPEGDIRQLELPEIIDIPYVQKMMDAFYEITKIGMSILDMNGEIIVSTGWQEICTKFHRQNPKSLQNCIESDLYLTKNVAPGSYRIYKCKNNMWDIVTPIFVGERQLGNLFTGQFIYEEEKIDYKQYRDQAKKYGFNEKEYIEALKKVPIRKEKTIKHIMAFFSKFAELISYYGYSNLKLARNIEELKIAEAERKKVEAQLRQAQKMDALGTLAGGIAHDFNNILAAIMGYSELAQDELHKTHPAYMNINGIINASSKAKNLVRQILTFTRKIESEKEQIYFNEIITDSIDLLRRTLPKMVCIDNKLDDNLNAINGDKQQIEQVIINLATNASDSINGKGDLLISTINEYVTHFKCDICGEYFSGDFSVLSISDNGCGMTTEIKSKIFEPFFTTKDKDKGTGLGLSTVYGIVKSHEAHLICNTAPGKGTVFKIYFPAIKQVDLGSKKFESSLDIFNTQGSEKILVVDDESSVRGIFETVLKKHGYRVLTAENGETALELYSKLQQEIDAVILDLGMPGMGGAICMSKLVELNPNVKILISSGYIEQSIIDEIKTIGDAVIIDKPFKKQILLKKLRKLLDKNRMVD